MVSPKRSRMPHPGLVAALVAGLVLTAGFWVRLHFTDIRISADPAREPEVLAAQERAQSVLDALEKYRADNGLYPASLSELSPGYLSSTQNLGEFRYSARRSDWVFQSEACLDRQRDLHEPMLQQTKSNQRDVSLFKRSCISGYRDYQLQSPDFAPAPQSRHLERWAYYDSQPRYWSVGWCEQVQPSGKEPLELATNGICRWRPLAQN